MFSLLVLVTLPRYTFTDGPIADEAREKYDQPNIPSLRSRSYNLARAPMTLLKGEEMNFSDRRAWAIRSGYVTVNIQLGRKYKESEKASR